jgi:deazaflavin-dependent oxidoreductase (nitroreductase family)
MFGTANGPLGPGDLGAPPSGFHQGANDAQAPACEDNAMKHYDNYLRWLYREGRPNRFARLQNRTTAIAFAAGILPKRAATLEVRGRRSGRVISFPVAIADFEGERYLVSMLGKNANWVRNLRAADGRAVLRHGRRESVHLEEVDPSLRAPILRRYLQVAPGARAHIPVDRRASLAEFGRIAADYPVFRIHAGAA